ncbi:nucleoside hydrolase [Halobaculum sp. MBLA0147]|uniref:nucleoside hydrolase n=1 Tax=Halobaculum sp. MBLA0147 TaxID=3079934 RepID=UPI003525CC69
MSPPDDTHDTATGSTTADADATPPPDPPQPTAEDPLPVVVDTDTASDDAVALAYAAREPRLDVRAVTVVAGNVPFDDQLRNAAYSLAVAGGEDVPVPDADDAPVARAEEIPLAAGARRPLVKSWEHATDVHGEGGLGGDLEPTLDPEPVEEYGPDLLRRLAREHDGELGVIAIGPPTNLAEALRRDPDLGDRLAGVWLMAGAVHCEGNVTPAAEYNAWVDPDATRLVVESLPVTLVDWGLTLRDGSFDAATLDRIAASDGERAAFLDAVTERARERSRSRPGPVRVPQPDGLAAAVAAHPELVESVGRHRVTVDDREGPTRGHTVVETDPDPPARANARVVERVDEEAFRERLLETVVGDDLAPPE